MPKDHFVPQHYLRQFSIDAKRIVVAKVSPYRFIGAAPINGQCQEQNFYEGNKPLDKLLWQSENDIAPVLARVVKNKDFDPKEAGALKTLASILHLRTRKAVEVAKVFPKFMALEFIQSAINRGELPPPPEGNLTGDMLDFRAVSGFLMQHLVSLLMEMHTLECKLLQAEPQTSFVTSDNPVVILNQFCAGAEPHRNHAGFSKSGFQLLLPISPNLCFCFYDAKIYRVGNRRARLVPISKGDVEIVNALQIQSAEECLYFHDPALEPEIIRLVDLYTALRVSIRDSLRVIPGPNENEELLHIRAPSAKLPTAWNFCRLRRHVNFMPGDRRDPSWTALATKLMEDIEHDPKGGDIFARLEKIIS